MSHERQFEIVNDPGAVHGHSRYDPLLHEVHENRTQSDFDDVGADAQDDRLALAMGLRDGFGDGAQGFDAEDIRQRAIELAEASLSLPGAGKVGDADFAMPFSE